MSAYSRMPLPGMNAPVLGYGSYHRRSRGGGFLLRPVKRVLGFFTAHEWIRMLLAFATVGTAIYSIQRAKWIGSQPSFVALLLVAMAVTAVTIRLKIPRIVKAAGLAVVGGVITGWLSSKLTGGQSLLSALATNPNEGTIHFAVFMIALTWAVGVLAVWLVLRRKNAWIPAAIGAAIVLINLSNLPPEHYNILPVFLLIALAFIGINALLDRRFWMSQNGGRFSEKANTWFIVSTLAIAGIAVIASSFVPVIPIERVGFDANGQFLSSLQKDWFNIFASVPGKWNIMRSEDLKSLSFASPVDNRDTVLFIVTSSQPAYWRINRYDDYSSWGWTSNTVDTDQILKAGTETSVPPPPVSKTFSYTVESRSKSDVVLLAGEFVSSSIPVKLESQGTSVGLTPDVQSDDLLSVITPELLQPYQRYTAVVSVSSATTSQLTKAGTIYPGWVTSHYLQVPLTLSPRVRQLARSLTQNVSDPYAKTVAIQDYLRGLKYNKDAKSPSKRGEETESFLFVQKEGVCTDFASAMVMMLRTIGIPARLATGYLPGQHETGTEIYTIRGKDYHAWPEVYFPGYGWIKFEPTPRPEIATDTPPAEPIGPSSPQSPPEDILIPDGGGPSVPLGPSAPQPKPNVVLPIVVGTLLGAAVLGLVWTFGRRLYISLRTSSSASGVYYKMCRFASMVGLGPVLAETPLEYCQRLATALPEGSDYVQSIGRVYTESSYSPRKDVGQQQMEELQKSWVRLYPMLFKRRLPWNR